MKLIFEDEFSDILCLRLAVMLEEVAQVDQVEKLVAFLFVS